MRTQRAKRMSWCGLAGVLSAAVLLSACEEKAPDKTGTLAPVELAPHPITPLPDPEEQGGHVGKAPRRITVAQLATSIEVTTGETWSQLEDLAPSLGQADYALIDAENTEPSLVFAKFLEDGAREVCTSAAKADLTRPLEERVLSRKATPADAALTDLAAGTVRENLVYLSQRFWGAPLQGEELEQWAALFQKAATKAEAIKKRDQAYAVLCIALMTDPRFLSY